MSGKGKRLLAGLLTLGAALAASGTARAAGSDTGLGIRQAEIPAAQAHDVRDRLYLVDHVAPAGVVHRTLVVSNDTGTATTVSVYAAAATVSGGDFRFADGHTGNELSRWITVSPASLALAAHQEADVEVTIAVPAGASSGERYAVVWAQGPPHGSPVAVVDRVGVRVYLSVGPGGEPPSDFVVDSLTAERDARGRPVVSALVHNTGQRALDLEGSLSLAHGPGGLSAGPYRATPGTTLAIGATAPVQVVLGTSIPDGPWQARLELASGSLRRAATALITFPSAAGQKSLPVKATAVPLYADRSVLLPVAVGLVVGVGVLLLLVLLWLRRRRDQGEQVESTVTARTLV